MSNAYLYPVSYSSNGSSIGAFGRATAAEAGNALARLEVQNRQEFLEAVKVVKKYAQAKMKKGKNKAVAMPGGKLEILERKYAPLGYADVFYVARMEMGFPPTTVEMPRPSSPVRRRLLENGFDLPSSYQVGTSTGKSSEQSTVTSTWSSATSSLMPRDLFPVENRGRVKKRQSAMGRFAVDISRALEEQRAKPASRGMGDKGDSCPTPRAGQEDSQFKRHVVATDQPPNLAWDAGKSNDTVDASRTDNHYTPDAKRGTPSKLKTPSRQRSRTSNDELHPVYDAVSFETASAASIRTVQTATDELASIVSPSPTLSPVPPVPPLPSPSPGSRARGLSIDTLSLSPPAAPLDALSPARASAAAASGRANSITQAMVERNTPSRSMSGRSQRSQPAPSVNPSDTKAALFDALPPAAQKLAMRRLAEQVGAERAAATAAAGMGAGDGLERVRSQRSLNGPVASRGNLSPPDEEELTDSDPELACGAATGTRRERKGSDTTPTFRPRKDSARAIAADAEREALRAEERLRAAHLLAAHRLDTDTQGTHEDVRRMLEARIHALQTALGGLSSPTSPLSARTGSMHDSSSRTASLPDSSPVLSPACLQPPTSGPPSSPGDSQRNSGQTRSPPSELQRIAGPTRSPPAGPPPPRPIPDAPSSPSPRGPVHQPLASSPSDSVPGTPPRTPPLAPSISHSDDHHPTTTATHLHPHKMANRPPPPPLHTPELHRANSPLDPDLPYVHQRERDASLSRPNTIGIFPNSAFATPSFPHSARTTYDSFTHPFEYDGP